MGNDKRDNLNEDAPFDYGSSVGRSFLDKLLLAFIDAYPDPSAATLSPSTAAKRRRGRLREARLLLFPGFNAQGRPLDPDNVILRWMGTEHYKDIVRQKITVPNAAKAPPLRSDRQLVEEARQRFGEPRSSVERLRDKFGRQRQQWLDVAIYHDDVAEQIDHNQLHSIADILARHGVAMNLDRVER
jgi:hypothetical protein